MTETLRVRRAGLWVTPSGRGADAYSEGVPPGPDPALARAAVESLLALRESVADAEDDMLACLVVTGEPRPQRVLDDWLDQVADTLRALGETASDLSPALARYADEPAGGVVGSRDAADANGFDANGVGTNGAEANGVGTRSTP
jgi:hypothetical protein